MSTLKVNTITNAAGTGNAAPTPIGVGQTWQNVTASRAGGTTYTNSTGRPIMISVMSNVTTAAQFTLNVGSEIVDTVAYNGTGGNISVQGIVPAGATYSIGAAAGTINRWMELR